MQPPGLAELQQRFLDAVRGAGPGDAALAPLLRPSHGLGVYVDAYFCRLRGVLAADFPQLAAALGDEPFTAAVRGYLRAHPSTAPSVRHVGTHLASWLARHPDPAAPWAADLARLEWARVEVFDAVDEPPLRAADLAAVPVDDWPALTLVPIGALELLAGDWPAHLLWDTPGSRPEPAPTCLRVWRQDHAVYHAPIDPEEHAALGRLRAGAPFAAACEAFRDPADVAAVLARWLEDGVLAHLA